MRKKISVILSIVLLVNIVLPLVTIRPVMAASKSIDDYKAKPVDDPLHIPASVPAKSANGYNFDDYYWKDPNYHVIVYGKPSNVPNNTPAVLNPKYGTMEYRYLGYDEAGNKFSNERYPDDVPNDMALSEKHWIFEPWESNLCTQTKYSVTDSCKKDIDRIKEKYGFTPYNGGTFFEYGNVQSYPTLLAEGSFRMWHDDLGMRLYQTFAIPRKPDKLDTPFEVKTEILSSDFTIDADENSVNVQVKVTAALKDQDYINDEIKKALYYTRNDIKSWYLKVEYKGAEVGEPIAPNGSNTITKTFTIPISRNLVKNGENITFVGVGRVTFHNDHYYRDSDPQSRVFAVVPNVVALSPDLSIKAPEKANVQENYTVEVMPVIPPGESMQSITLESSFNGSTYTQVSLSGLKATQNYPTTGTVNYRATVRISNGNTAQATATTQIVDERSAGAKADVFLPEHDTFEGHYITAYNRNKFYFDGHTYGPQTADDLGLGESEFYVYDSSQYDLDSDLYDTANVDDNDSMDVKFNEPGDYKIGLAAIPLRGEEDEDVEAVKVKPCPHIVAYLLGSRKDDRKLTLDFSQTVVNPDYPLVSSKTYIKIEDINAGESVTVTNFSHPDSTNIKTRALTGNVLDFLIEASVQKNFKATIYVEDTRGESDTEVINFIVKPDLPPVAEATASLVQYRDSSGIAKVRIGKSGKSNDGDELKVNDLKYRVDTDNDGSFDDEMLDSLSSSLTDLEAVITTDRVGRILLDYTVQEDLTPDTLPEFVTASDYLSDHRTKVIDVDNLQPHTALRAIKSRMVDQLLIGNSTDTGTLSTKADAAKTSLNGLENPIDLSNSVKGVKISDKIIEQDITISNGEDFKSLLAVNDTHYAYITNLGNLYIREFSTGIRKKKITGWTGGRGASAGDWLTVLSSYYYVSGPGYKVNYIFCNTKTGQTLSGTMDGVINSIEYNENTQLVNVDDAYLFDAVGGYIIQPVGYLPSQVIYREGGKAYVVTKVFSYNDPVQYTLKEIDLATGNASDISFFATSQQIGLETPDLIIKYYPEHKKALLLDMDKSFNFVVTLCNFRTKTISPFGYYAFNHSYPETQDSGDIWNYTFADLYGVEMDADLSTNACYISFTGVYQYKRKSGSKTYYYYYFIDTLLRGTTGTTAQNRYWYKYLGQDYDSDDYNRFTHSRNIKFYKNKVINKWSSNISAGIKIFNGTSLALEYTGGDYRNPKFGKSEEELYDEYLADTLMDYYYVKNDESSSGKDRWYLRHAYPGAGGNGYKILISNGDDRLALHSDVVINGKTWGVYYEDVDWIGNVWFVDKSTDQVYRTGMIAGSERPAEVTVSGSKIWFFGDYRFGYFDTETQEIKDAFDLGMGVPFVALGMVQSPDGKYLHVHDGKTSGKDIYVYEFPDRFKNRMLEYMNGFTAREGSAGFVTVMTDKALTLPAADITAIVNAIKGKGLKCLWLGNSLNRTAGESIAVQTGGVYMSYANYDSAFSQLQNYYSGMIPKNDYYVMNVKKGQAVSYDRYYFDLEKDTQIPSTIRWRYRHIPSTDGKASFSDQWLSSPVASFDKNGIYYVSWDVQDNPKPADTDSRFASYRKYSVREELMIVVGDAEPPAVQVIDPTLNIRIGGSLKQNRKVTADLEITLGTEVIDYTKTAWTVTAVSGGTANDIKVKTISDISRHLLFKKPGRYHIRATVKDVNGSSFSKETDIDIVPDQPIKGNITVTPNPAYRDAQGKTKETVTATITSPDDFIESLKYFLIYDSDNDGSFADETPQALAQYDNITSFEPDIARGVGSYMISAEAKEGFLEETIPEFITEDDYSKLDLGGRFTVGNIAPLYDIRPDKEVYLAGEEIRYISGFYMNELKGDMSKGYFDTENDPMTNFKVKYTQDRTAMPEQDSTSAYHNVELSGLLNSLDRAGLYTVQANAWDDPKAGDERFRTFRAESNTSENTLIVHRPPKAAASFTCTHDTETNFNFGNNMYLEGTHLNIYDASFDPDGFTVATRLSYKTGNGSYLTINSGDAVTLTFGSIVTVKVETQDNWGAPDTALYTITVVNDLDMVPEVIPSPVPAGERVTLRLTTNQYATSARTVVFGENIPLAMVSQTDGEKRWEAVAEVPETQPDRHYTAEFYASGEGMVELRKDRDFEVDTPINLVPDMPSLVTAGETIEIKAVTTKYANMTRVTLYKDTEFETTLNMEDDQEGDNKVWSILHTIPEQIPDGSYIAEFRATTPNGNVETREWNFSVNTLEITGVTIQGYWNHWRGQTDLFGEQMTDEPHRFLSLERVKISIWTAGFAEKVVIRFSPELEAMTYTNELNHTYDYKDDFLGYYVHFPQDATFIIDNPEPEDQIYWEYTLPLAPGTKAWDNSRTKEPYRMTVYAYKGETCVPYEIDDIDITGNIYDLTYIQPIN